MEEVKKESDGDRGKTGLNICSPYYFSPYHQDMRWFKFAIFLLDQ